jgi:hypothetical protein
MLPNHKVIVVADRKNEWASLFMEWGDDLYRSNDCDHLRDAYIDQDKDTGCTAGEEESSFLDDL